MLDERGFIAETNATHLFFVERGVLKTPRLRACPEGITRKTVLEICERDSIPFEVDDFTLTELYRADEVFCTGTMGEVASVTEVDGRNIGDGSVGPMTQNINKKYQVFAQQNAEPIV